jgi:hypothetical protein
MVKKMKITFHDGERQVRNVWFLMFTLATLVTCFGMELAMFEAGFTISSVILPCGIACLIGASFIDKYETEAKVRVRRNNHRQKMIGPKLASTPKRKARMS